MDHKLSSRTYLAVEGERLMSDVDRNLGVFEVNLALPGSGMASGTPQRLAYEERSLSFVANQLVSDHWSLGARYRLSEADLLSQLLEIPLSVSPVARSENSATLQQLSLFALFNHPSGLFADTESLWWQQSNRGYSPDQPDDDLWQFNVFMGYRFFHRRAELRIGLLNLTDRDCRLNPLNYYAELPRERTLTARFKFEF